MSLKTDATVGELVRARPARARLFEELRIDYCCGGKLPLAEACAQRGLDPQEVLARLAQMGVATAPLVDADQLTLTALADHIEATHHTYLRQELPRLDYLTRKVSAAHAARAPELATLRGIFERFQADLCAHMAKEEQVLFPLVRQLDQSERPIAFPCGSVANPIQMMEHEHDEAGAALEQFRVLTHDYTPPDWACNTVRALFDALQTLELDMHQHVHKENNVLFPKAVAREQRLAAAASQ